MGGSPKIKGGEGGKYFGGEKIFRKEKIFGGGGNFQKIFIFAQNIYIKYKNPKFILPHKNLFWEKIKSLWRNDIFHKVKICIEAQTN